MFGTNIYIYIYIHTHVCIPFHVCGGGRDVLVMFIITGFVALAMLIIIGLGALVQLILIGFDVLVYLMPIRLGPHPPTVGKRLASGILWKGALEAAPCLVLGQSIREDSSSGLESGGPVGCVAVVSILQLHGEPQAHHWCWIAQAYIYIYQYIYREREI